MDKTTGLTEEEVAAMAAWAKTYRHDPSQWEDGEFVLVLIERLAASHAALAERLKAMEAKLHDPIYEECCDLRNKAEADLAQARAEVAGFPNLSAMRQCMVDTANQNQRLRAAVEGLHDAVGIARAIMCSVRGWDGVEQLLKADDEAKAALTETPT